MCWYWEILPILNKMLKSVLASEQVYAQIQYHVIYYPQNATLLLLTQPLVNLYDT